MIAISQATRREQKREHNRRKRARWSQVGKGAVSVLLPGCDGWYATTQIEFDYWRLRGAYPADTQYEIDGQRFTIDPPKI